jgi:hypothetical protein
MVQTLVVDIELVGSEQDLPDHELAGLSGIKIREAARVARSQRRRNVTLDDIDIIFRLPVIVNWQHFPQSLSSFLHSAVEAGPANKSARQFVLWSEGYEHKYQGTYAPTDGQTEEQFDLGQLRQGELEELLKSVSSSF